MTLAVRPENVCLRAGGDEGLRGEVTNVIYHGDHVRYEVRTRSSGHLLVRGSTDESLRLGHGDRVSLTWDENKARVLDGAASGLAGARE